MLKKPVQAPPGLAGRRCPRLPFKPGRAKLPLIGLALLLGLVFLSGGGQAAADTRPPAAGMGVLAGRVFISPISPVHGPGIPPAVAPAAGVKLLVYDSQRRQEIAAATTDEAGQFRLELPPGAYRVELAPLKGKAFTKDLPAAVSITAGRETRLEVRLDTGIR